MHAHTERLAEVGEHGRYSVLRLGETGRFGEDNVLVTVQRPTRMSVCQWQAMWMISKLNRNSFHER